MVFNYPDGTRALSGIDMKIHTGSRTAVIGSNGSGKSTLLLHFNGLLRPTSGDVLVGGVNVERSNLNLIRTRVGMVFQDPDSQLFAPTVKADIAYGPQNMGMAGDELQARVGHIMDQLHLNDISGRPCRNLSGGQKKKVAIAGVLAMEPDILVLDEPTTGLDYSSTSDIMDILDELNSDGKTIILSTHDMDLASSWADYIYVLHRGEVLAAGAPRQVLSDDTMAYATGMRLPTVVQTYREFEARGIAEGRVPMTILDLVDSMDVPYVGVRCAVADCRLVKGQKVGLIMREGTIVAVASTQLETTGRAMSDAEAGDEVLVGDVSSPPVPTTGTIQVVQIPRIIQGGSRHADINMIKCLVKQRGIDRVGAMGTSARVTAVKAGLKLDFEVDVIQSAMLSALRGHNCLILASGGMAQRVKQRVDERNRDKKRVIRCNVLNEQL